MEALLSFFLIITIILSFLNTQRILIRKWKDQMHIIEMNRMLYEETRDYRFYKGETNREKTLSRKYQISLTDQPHQATQIISGKNQVSIESTNVQIIFWIYSFGMSDCFSGFKRTFSFYWTVCSYYLSHSATITTN